MYGYTSLSSHGNMVYDAVRNVAYAKAIRNLVNPESVVIDLGAGLGLLGLIAAKAGARRVYLVEPNPWARLARDVVRQNKLEDRVTVIPHGIESADIPEKADLIISVFTGNMLFEEDLLPLLFWARDRHLKSGGVLLPDMAELHLAPVCAKKFHQNWIAQWSQPSEGIDFSSIRLRAANSLQQSRPGSAEAEFIAAPQSITCLDFYSATEAGVRSEVTFKAESSAECHGLLGWIRIRLGSQWLATSPGDPDTHWTPLLLPFDPPMSVRKGQEIAVRLIRPENGDWTWTASCNGKVTKHSTFLSRPFDAASVRLLSNHNGLELNETGHLVKYVLNQLEHGASPQDIIASAMKQFVPPGKSQKQFAAELQEIILRFTN